jgi:uncharacterized membrane-anchored protein
MPVAVRDPNRPVGMTAHTFPLVIACGEVAISLSDRSCACRLWKAFADWKTAEKEPGRIRDVRNEACFLTKLMRKTQQADAQGLLNFASENA